MKITARMSETGTTLRAENDDDWAVAHPAGQPGPVMFCPDSTCDVRVNAVERKRNDGQVTRFFRFSPHGPKCGHEEVSVGVVVPARKPPARTGETSEHRWLKQYVQQAAIPFGYDGVTLETQLSPVVRADVFVPGAQRGRVEIQRGPTDLRFRTNAYPNVVWLLREVRDANKNFLFNGPCVQVRISRRTDSGRWLPAKPWEEPGPVFVQATATVLRARADPDVCDRYGFFEPDQVRLDTFLGQVWSGQRLWFKRHEVHKFAGWITVDDHRKYMSWLAEREDQRRSATKALAVVTSVPAEAHAHSAGTPLLPPVPAPPATPAPEASQHHRASPTGTPEREDERSHIATATNPSKTLGLWSRIRSWFRST